MSTVTQTAEEVLESLTGFDEMAISQHFGRPVGAFAEDQSMLARVLVFVLKRREGLNDDDARNAVLNLPLREVLAFFPSESAESGKDEQPSVTQPASSLASVS